jgi:hypothetical protein
MAKLSGAICEAIVLEYGRSALFSRLIDPFWFNPFGVLGMDRHSSGITTSVISTLKKASHAFGRKTILATLSPPLTNSVCDKSLCVRNIFHLCFFNLKSFPPCFLLKI